MNRLRIIKFIVLLLTCLIVAASTILLGCLTKKVLSEQKMQPVTNLSQPQGSVIKQIKADNGLLHIFISGGNLADRIITYNPRKKQIISNLSIYEE